MASLREEVAEVLSPSFIDDIGSISVEELRRRRDQAIHIESVVSYTRRLVQAMIDIAEASNTTSDSSELIGELSEILSDGNPHSSAGRLVEVEISEEASLQADQFLQDSLAGPPSKVDRLAETEREISEMRQKLHSVLDRLSSELVEQYKNGRASVEGLLEDVRKG